MQKGKKQTQNESYWHIQYVPSEPGSQSTRTRKKAGSEVQLPTQGEATLHAQERKFFMRSRTKNFFEQTRPQAAQKELLLRRNRYAAVA